MIGSKRCVLVVDDEAKMVRAIQDLLKANGFSVLCAYDGEEALECFYASSAQIDLILLDIMMPKLNGYEVLDNLRQNDALTPTILLTARGEEYDQVKGFKAGADDYITKPFSPSLLLMRIEALLKRVGKTGAEDIQCGKLCISPIKRSVICGVNTLHLTKREFDLLLFFATNPLLVFSREQILNSVWGYDFEGESRTVDTHVKQLRIKLQEQACYIKTVHRIGYQFEVPHEES